VLGPAATFGLTGWPAKAVLIAITIAAAAIAFGVMRWVIPRLARRLPPGSDPAKARQRQTAVALLTTIFRYLILVVAILAIVVILVGGGGLGALGGSAVVAIIIGFAAQRLLADMIAGFFILFEGQYGVGDVIQLQPSAYTGVVEEIGVRTTILRDADGDRCFVPNSQITAVRRFPSARAMLSVTLLTRIPDEAEAALGALGDLRAAGAGVAAGAQSITRRDIGDGVVAVHGRLAVAATMLDEARDLVAAVLTARLGDTLAVDPVVATVEPREAERPEAHHAG
jgi:small conductance mechanosensitive channel